MARFLQFTVNKLYNLLVVGLLLFVKDLLLGLPIVLGRDPVQLKISGCWKGVCRVLLVLVTGLMFAQVSVVDLRSVMAMGDELVLVSHLTEVHPVFFHDVR